MAEKRFTYEYDEYSGNLFDNNMHTFYHIEDSDENIEVLCDRLNWLVEENEQLKEEIKGLNDILARYEEKELQAWNDLKDKSCGHCKYLQIDGMFGMWCDKGRNWENTDAKYCSDYKR